MCFKATCGVPSRLTRVEIDKIVELHNEEKRKYGGDQFALVNIHTVLYMRVSDADGWLGSRVVSVLDSGAEGPGFKSQSRRCRVTVLGKLFTPIVSLFTKQQNW